MRTSDFDYQLPKGFIAQNPAEPRDHSKLMVYDTASDEVLHKQFFDLVEFLRAGDVLVLNRSKVIPARILFVLNGSEKEIFLLKKLSETDYEVLVRPGKFFKVGKKFRINENLEAEILEILSDGNRIVRFFADNLDVALKKAGSTPLPPYIDQSRATFDQYQTVYAKEEGSKAAPTAGLHFTEDLLKKLKEKGVEVEEVLLHVGLGTFLPVSTDNIEEHVMHSEEFVLSKDVADRLNKAKLEGRRIIAVGTTSVRVLESCYLEEGFVAGSGDTNIFIYPGKHSWKAVDALITNFHLPKSTLIMLVASFLENKGIKDGTDKILGLYKRALENNYRFYSFGDAMFLF